MSLMNRMCAGLLVAGASQGALPVSLMAQQPATEMKAEADKPVTPSQLPGHGAIPEGKVLPHGVGRSWILHRHYTSDFGFNDKGDRITTGLKRSTAVTGLVAEYGITSQLSFRMLVPVIYRNQLSMDQNQFRNSETFKKLYREKADAAADKLRGMGLCPTTEACREILDAGDINPPAGTRVTLGTGESVVFTGDRSFKSQIEESILRGATPPLNGPTGLGDVEAGFLYNAVRHDNMLVSVGIGLRSPTGKFDVPELKRPLSGGIYDLGMRLNIDYSPVYGLWLSYQEQLEQALNKATWKRSSLVNNDEFNAETPTDGIANRQTFEKFGVSRITLLKANYGFGGLSPDLKFLAMNIKYIYAQERAVRLGGEEYLPGITTAKPRSATGNLGAGIAFTGLPYRIPVDFEINYLTPVTGSHNKVASSILESYLRVYARF